MTNSISDEVKNPFTTREQGFVAVHFGELFIRGQKGSQKEGFAMQSYGVLVFDNAVRAGYIFLFKTRKTWRAFQECHTSVFCDDVSVDWSTIVNDDKLDKIIALKDAHVNNNELPPEKKEKFVQEKNEIFIHRIANDGVFDVSVTSQSLDEHYLIFDEIEYIQLIGHIKKMATVEKAAMRFRRRNQPQQTTETLQSASKAINQKYDATRTRTPQGTGRWLYKMLFFVFSVLAVFVSVGTWKYQQHQQMLLEQEMERQRLEELERQWLEELQLAAQKLLSNSTAEIVETLSDQTAVSMFLGVAAVILLTIFVLERFFCGCRTRPEAETSKKWKRGKNNGRLYSIE